MKLRNISIAILVILIGIGFTSCEEDEWVRDTLLYTSYDSTPLYFNDRGVLRAEPIELDMRDILVSRGERIRDVRAYDSFFILTSKEFRAEDRPILRLETGGRVYSGEMIYLGLNQKTRSYEYIIDKNDPNYARFIDNLFNDLNRYGHATLYFDAKVQYEVRILGVDFEFQNNLDVAVSR